jgi:glycosyltransferase involved in cell wall biosynthesis
MPADAELLVVDDGSRDDSAQVAAEHGARVLHHERALGPGAARNRGADAAASDILVFLDADVRVHADTLPRLLSPFEDSGVAAAFGSYDDDAPPGASWVGRYKNLAHHYVHQRSREEASTFWAGCGAMRRDVFRALGGFDARYQRPSIEDVELGYRARARGHRIRLVREARVTHLKRWTLASWLASDFRDRAVPWARLVRAGRGLPNDLNFTGRDRTASALVGASLGIAPVCLLEPRAAWALAAGVAGALALDAEFLAFAARRVSPAFACATAPLHLLHRAVGLTGFVVGWLS